ncbi:MAG: hypothetical protein SRB1_00410 [Desulfobacteraceae bacterium Eth-SRB1]|nr:MAG: hypothetical protein SRB1_00410 [Desulfobacteraceae bacterium Eth-SRB1]
MNYSSFSLQKVDNISSETIIQEDINGTEGLIWSREIIRFQRNHQYERQELAEHLRF